MASTMVFFRIKQTLITIIRSSIAGTHNVTWQLFNSIVNRYKLPSSIKFTILSRRGNNAIKWHLIPALYVCELFSLFAIANFNLTHLFRVLKNCVYFCFVEASDIQRQKQYSLKLGPKIKPKPMKFDWLPWTLHVSDFLSKQNRWSMNCSKFLANIACSNANISSYCFWTIERKISSQKPVLFQSHFWFLLNKFA